MCRRGELYWPDLDPYTGSEQGGERPVLVLQDDHVNRVSRTVVVVPFTTNLRRANLPTALFLRAGTGGLLRDSVALCHHIRAIDKQRLRGRIGQMLPADVGRVETVVLRTLGISQAATAR
jgi:mRNA interferase MazF